MNYSNIEDTICAIATGGGTSAIAIIRISGKNAIQITNNIFSKNLLKSKSHTIHLGDIKDNKEIIDEVLVSVFKKNASYTGEETIEISCHGSIYIQKKILQKLINEGCRMASAGEFTIRAFKNGKLDLSQAESVADLIASESKSEQQVAIKQLKGGFSNKLQELRKRLIDFASLIELELDFSEEDVEFADRDKFQKLLAEIKHELSCLINSFNLGNVIKNGIPVTILGPPNAGKSTLLNALLNEEKAIVSEIPGTTRDVIEDKLIIEGLIFRFIDTAGIRDTNDVIENLGIKKAFENVKKSEIILYIMDSSKDIKKQTEDLKQIKEKSPGRYITIINKIDINNIKNIPEAICISAKKEIGLDKLKQQLINITTNQRLSNNETIVTNIRHYEELTLTLHEINTIIEGLNNNISGEFLASNIRQALLHIGSITGEISNDTLLGNIFSKFCIGK
ncbi:MAG: tRNA uridine-5-carboxymethylaminomethyl(34) synthesis GTPase MnmE [Bacteroidota bacterium]|nr:tRNA uridine-5-carboxymethylaminomethyl(34) synthesis GTPase MnmE [Bacteroidota bacterium]